MKEGSISFSPPERQSLCFKQAIPSFGTLADDGHCADWGLCSLLKRWKSEAGYPGPTLGGVLLVCPPVSLQVGLNLVGT